MVKLALIDNETNKVLGELDLPADFTEQMAIELDEMLRRFNILSEWQELALVDVDF